MSDIQSADMVRGALIEVGRHLSKKDNVFGAAPEDDNDLIASALRAITRLICPHKEMLLQRLDTPGATAAAIIVDALANVATALPIPAATLSKEIAKIGLVEFCSDPTELLRSRDK